MIKFEVVLSPALLDLYDLNNKNVVVVDILRATSTIVTALANGVASIRPCINPKETLQFKNMGYITAGETNGEKIEGFDIGNSPFECMNIDFKGKNIALTTTNGTKCFLAAQAAGAEKIFAGSFLNLKSMSDFLVADAKDVLVICAGWKNKINLEDSLFSGALLNEMMRAVEIKINCDSSIMMLGLYLNNKNEMINLLKKSSHYHRLSHLSHEEDMVYCLNQSITEGIFEFKGNDIKEFSKKNEK